MILETFLPFLKRLSDNVFPGRNRARIVVGTDRKNTADSGYGDGGENDPESAAIDLVAGFDPESGDPSFENDKSRIYLSEKCDPDDYLGVNKGPNATAEPGILHHSTNVYIKSRKKTKIIGPKYSVVIDEDGNCLIEAETKIEIKVEGNVVRLNSNGIELDGGQGLTGKIITDNDTCVGTDPVTGSPILSNFKSAGAIVTNNKAVVK